MFRILLLHLFSFCSIAQTILPGFTLNEYSEQTLTFRYEPEIIVTINAPAADHFNKDLPSGIILYALPNGNSTAWTIGKILNPGDDWHFGIQNIGAQTRFLREKIKEHNIITIYLETDQKSWPAWKARHQDYASIIKQLTESILERFNEFNPSLILSGHSGGGRFIFSFLDAHEKIPDYVKRICFLDSNYGYDSSYTSKISEWLRRSSDNYLSVLAYNDSSVVLNGKNIVSPTGGTWYRSRLMVKDLSEDFPFTFEETDEFINYSAQSGRIKILLKKNPQNEILHTIQVEKNGFIHTILTGTPRENKGYIYFGDKAY